MVRQIIQIDEEKCNGCGICADACHEGAIAIIDGKAKLTRDDYCDGFGDCLPGCPMGAISFIEKDTLAYDEAAVEANKKRKEEAAKAAASIGSAFKKENRSMEKTADNGGAHGHGPGFSGCPGSRMATFERNEEMPEPPQGVPFPYAPPRPVSQLAQWPCQIKLVPVNAPYFDGAKLLIAADCTAYAYANVHHEFMRGKVTLIGCPKLDDVDYSEKLTAIIANNDIKEVTVLRMEVPCCGGLQMAAINALKASGKFIPWQVVTFTIDGKIKE